MITNFDLTRQVLTVTHKGFVVEARKNEYGLSFAFSRATSLEDLDYLLDGIARILAISLSNSKKE